MSIQEKKYTSKKTGKTANKYFAVVHNPTTNKKIWSKGYDRKKDALQKEREMVHEVENGFYNTIIVKNTFEELASEWLAVAPTLYANSTYRVYNSYTHSYILPVFGKIQVSVITPLHIQKFITTMGKNYSAETVNKCLNILSNIYQFGVSLNIVPNNPCEKIKRLRVQATRHNTWTEKQIMYFFKLPEVRSSFYYDMFILSFTTGLRPSELCGISETDFKDSNILTITRGFDKHGKLTNLKTNASHRPIELTDLLGSLLRARLKNKELMRSNNHLDFEYIDTDFLFTFENGSPVNPNLLSHHFRKLLDAHNKKIEKKIKNKIPLLDDEQMLPRIRFYDARHSFATNSILSNNASIKVISEILGHSNIKTTLHNYSHVSQSMSKQVISDYSNKILAEIF